LEGTSKILRKQEIESNGIDLLSRKARKLCLKAFESALKAVDPAKCLQGWLRVEKNKLRAGPFLHRMDFDRIVILSVGKASVPMLETAMSVLGRYQISAVLVTPDGSPTKGLQDTRITIFEAGHPFPNQEGLRAARYVESITQRMSKNELLICLISGGASSLLAAPPEGVTLKEKSLLTAHLIRSNATIHEINTVRRHLSQLKGGRLAEKCPASTILSFIMSDVVGNSLQDIGSGLTAPDPTTYADAIEVLKKHNLWTRVPKSITSHFQEALRGRRQETVKPSSPTFKRVHNFIIADNRVACEAAARTLKGEISCKILTSSAGTDAGCMGRLLAAVAADSELIQTGGSLVIGGETTVTVHGTGIGGRNQEVALSAVEQISGRPGTVIAAMGTDGIDGNSPAAGAIIDGNTLKRAEKLRMKPKNYLKRNDSYHFFRKLHDNIITGRTGTNVGDVYLLIRV
jgi:hydroxypyruvate reductase